MNRPNVLMIYTDQQRWDAFTASGNPLISTPNLDRLAARGAFFRNAFVNCPVCMPSRMSTLSGRYPGTLGIRFNGTEMPQDIPCVQHLLSPYGYHSANIGKLHFRNHAAAFRDHRDPHPPYGFDTLILSDEPGCYDDAYIKWVEQQDPAAVSECRADTPPAWTGPEIRVHPRDVVQPYVFEGPEHLSHTAFVAEETCSFLRRMGDRPFFAIAGIYAPHAPINPPKRFVDMYEPASMPLPVRRDGENFRDVPDEQWRKIKAYYYALVSHVDDQVGRILDCLEQQGIADNTLVIFTADHGENLGDHGRIGKTDPYDSSTRVPLIVSMPGRVAAGQERHEIVESVDLVPTILDWCGVQQPPFCQGRSFRPLLTGDRGYQERDSAFFDLSAGPGHGYKAVRTADRLYVREADGTEQLYDLSEDPDQIRDLADESERAADLLRMRSLLLSRWFQSDTHRPRTAHY